MALRETYERLQKAGEIQRPSKPGHGTPEHHGRHYAVHLGINAIHELTDAPVDHLHDLMATTIDDELLHPDELHEIASRALGHLIELTDHFSPADYASIYAHLQQGLSSTSE